MKLYIDIFIPDTPNLRAPVVLKSINLLKKQ